MGGLRTGRKNFPRTGRQRIGACRDSVVQLLIEKIDRQWHLFVRIGLICLQQIRITHIVSTRSARARRWGTGLWGDVATISLS
jgi:hypothetical protein